MHLFNLPSTRPETVAAIDLGSNSFHMIVARFENNQIQVIDKLKDMVRLGAGLRDDKTLDEKTAERAIECLKRFGQRLAGFPPGSVRAVGTNTLRQVRDPSFIEKAELALGHPIEIIAGREEARLIYLGVANGLDTGDKIRLVVDIGGGSTELIVGQRFKIFDRESLHMGCVSYSQRFFSDDLISKENMKKAIIAGRLDLRPVKKTFNSERWKIAIGSSGTIRAIREVVQQMGWSERGITAQSLDLLRAEMINQGSVEKLDLKGLSNERKPVFAGGVAVLSALFKTLNIQLMQVSDEALREGLLYEMVDHLQDEDIRDKTIKTFSERYNIDKSQARRVKTTAMQLLAQVADDWKMQHTEYMDLMEWAARLHEIGLTISHSSFHKHGAYILDNADMSGFSRQQQHILATLVRAHRRKINADLFNFSSPELTQFVIHLAVILRLAVLMHRGRNGSAKPKLKLQAVDIKKLQVTFPQGWLEEHPLTRVEMKEEARYLKYIDFELAFE
jgi:exopolyphosphatase/guanosine-5'-triphosphate,3'-diphosphate pyrophosphatase